MRTFHLKIDLTESAVLSASGFGSGIHHEGPARLLVRLRRRVGSRTVFVWGRFDSFADESAFEEWVARVNPSGLGAWLRSVEGDFIVVVLDETENQIHVMADRNGQYRVYTCLEGSIVSISNSLRAMIRLTNSPRLSSLAIYQLLTMKFNSDPNSLLENVNVLPLGEILSFDSKGVRSHRYHDPVELDPSCFTSVKECVDALDAALRSTLARRVKGKGEPLLLLSGGIDSVVLLQYLSEMYPGSVRTLTYGLEGFAEREFDAASRAAKYFGSQHRELVIPVSRLSEFYLKSVAGADTSYYGAVIQNYIREELEVVGSFEMFGGIDSRLHTPPVDRVREIGLWINARLARPGFRKTITTGMYWPDYFVTRLSPRSSYADFILKLFLGYRQPDSSLGQDEWYARLLRQVPAFSRHLPREVVFRQCIRYGYGSQYSDDMNYHVSCLESDMVSVHLPYLDHTVIEASNRIPFHLATKTMFTLRSGRRFVPFVDKNVARRLLRKGVPHEVLYRKKEAADQLHVFFEDRNFKKTVDVILDRWLPGLLSGVDGFIRALLRNFVDQYRGLSVFTSADTYLLRCVYVIAYLCLLNEMCRDDSFDIGPALEEIGARSITKVSK